MYLFKKKYLILKTVVALLTVVASTFPALSQTDFTKLTDVLHPSPNAASLGKYGGLNTGLSSGMLSVSIPIYQYESHSLKLPVSLSYSSNGLKVDEIASRVGQSWSLNAGGAITRSVMGTADEQAARVIPPADFPQRTQNLINFVEALNDKTANDGEPDVFSFNFDGYSGQFILDNSLNPVLLGHSALKIEKDFTGAAGWNFKITSPKGEQYFFGGSAATETTNKFQSGCGKSYAAYVPTAWYLIRTVHPNRDTLTFTYSPIGYSYKTGVTETMYGTLVGQNVPSGAQPGPPPMPNTSCLSWMQTNTVLLQEINSTSGGRLKFLYADRTDVGDKLLSRIEVYQRSQSVPLSYFNFYYQTSKASGFSNSYTTADTSLSNRPFLTSIVEGSPSTSQTQTHRFFYNQGQLPPRLSYAQDAYGYFNGKSNNTLIPHPAYPYWTPYFSGATADRSADALSASMGMLNKIQYPTGGYDTVLYEANTNYQLLPNNSTKTVYLTGVGIDTHLPNQQTSPTFGLVANETATLVASCSYDPHSGFPEDDLHNKCTVTVLDVTSGTTLFSQILVMNQSISQLIPLSSGHSYQLQITPYGAAAQASANLSYPDDTVVPQYANVPVGGLRVSKVITKAAASDAAPQVKSYYYYNSATPSVSSASLIYAPQFEKYLRVLTQSHAYPTGDPAGTIICAPSEYDYYAMFSNTQISLYAYPAPVYYTSVFESLGDNFQNGGVEHRFQLWADAPGQSILGDPIPNAPLSGYGWRNGRELYTCTFKMNGASMVPVRKVFTHYKEDSRINQEYVSYMVNKKFSPACTQTPTPLPGQFDAYDLVSYSHFREWVYPDTVRTWAYNSAGTAYQEELAVSEYGNPSHAMLTKSTVTTSDGKASVTAMAYPQDLTLTGPEETARLALVAQNNISALLSQHSTRGTSEVSTTKVNYLVYPNGMVLPHVYNVKVGNNAAQDRVIFNGYNHRGQLTSESLVGGAPVSFIYDYRAIMPTAKVTNADTTSIAYTSFEADGSGRWTIGSSQRDSSTAITGYRSYNLSGGTLSRSGLTSSATYVVSYWTKTAAALTITGTIAGYPITGMKTQNWYYHEHHVTGVTAITLLGTGSIDEVRLYPLGSQMATFTYSPMIGITSSADARSNLSYYEYDGLQRLLNVRDKDGNILKNYNYNYASQAAAWADTGTPECVQGASGNTGEQRVQQTDTNPYSATYGAHQWRSISTNSSSCPVSAGVYVQQTVGSTSVSNGVTYNTLKFNTYSDANCTTLVNAPATLTVNYTYVTSASYADGRTPNPTVTTTNATITIASGTNQATSGSIIVSGCNGIGTKQICYTPTTQITVQPGTGYTPVNIEN